VLVEVPGAPEAAPPEPVLPELPDEPPDEPPCPKASEAWASRTAVTNASVFGRMAFLPLGANASCCHPFRTTKTVEKVGQRNRHTIPDLTSQTCGRKGTNNVCQVPHYF
jgi:hypothetical protein